MIDFSSTNIYIKEKKSDFSQEKQKNLESICTNQK